MLDSLHIKNFRCFEDLTIPSLGQVNLIVGKNNSGKTTLLDAIYLYANSGNIWAIHQTLLNRNDSPQIEGAQQSNLITPQSNNQARTIFDSLANIFSRKSNSTICSITANKNWNPIHIEVEKTNDIEKMKRKHGIPEIQYQSLIIPTTQQNPQEGFLVTVRWQNLSFPYNIACTPYSIINDILKINPGIYVFANSYVGTCAYQESSLADTWSTLQDKGDDININKALKIIEPNISRAYYTVDRKIAKVQLDGVGTQTLKSMGDGISRIFQLFILTYSAKGGILIIDEIENGLHYSIQEEVWEKLFQLAKELDIQVFATTHSEDTIKAFSKIAIKNPENYGKIIALGRSAYGEDKGKIIALTHSGNDFQYIATGTEIR